MKVRYWVFIVLSAILYGAAFVGHKYLWWLIFAFPIPLFYCVIFADFSFKQGFVWGLVTFLVHGLGGMDVIMRMSGNYWWMAIVFYVGMVLYQALFSALFFWISALIRHFFHKNDQFFRLCLAVITLALYIMWVDRYCFYIFDRVEGYPLMHPLIALMHQPSLVCLLSVLGKFLLTIVFLLCAATSVAVIVWKNRISATCFVIVLLFWAGCYCVDYSTQQHPAWVSKIIVFPYMTVVKASSLMTTMHMMGHQLKKLCSTNPGVRLVVMPESAFDTELLWHNEILFSYWGRDVIGDDIHVIFGAFRTKDNYYYNTLHWVYDGALQCCFDKRHAMVLSERLPSLLCYSWMRSIYFDKGSEVAVSSGIRPKIIVDDVGEFVPYLCSELFFNEYPDDEHSGVPIIALVNDSIFNGSFLSCYMSDLLVLLARMKAVLWQRDIVYVSYYNALLIDKNGKSRRL